MDDKQAENLVRQTFENPFNRDTFTIFLKNLFKNYREIYIKYPLDYIPETYRYMIESIEKLGEYEDNNDNKIDLLIITLKRESSLERARTMQRNFVAWYLRNSNPLKDAALVAFITPHSDDWRLSLIKIDYKYTETPSGKIKIKEEFTPAKRWSFLVGKNEKTYTPKKNFFGILRDDSKRPTLNDLENVFNIEVITEEFFKAYKEAINKIKLAINNSYIPENKKHSFAQLLLSRIMFLYFLQRKGWFKWKNYEIDKNYMRKLWDYYKKWQKNNKVYNVFYSKWLTSLFFGAFNKKSHLINKDLPDEIKESFKLMPFLNGGLFSKTELDELNLNLPDDIFQWLFEPDSNDLNKGFFEIYNFTIDESSPLDVEVAVDPEMLGRVYESLIAEEERGNVGIFYTPRVEIDFMCRISLIEYLASVTHISKDKIIDFIYDTHNIINKISKDECKIIKEKLDNIKIVDPAVGSASFLVGMLNILVNIHTELTRYLEGKEENLFALKEKIILENLYGVDVKDWAVMVGELRLWLSLIVETDEKYMDIYTKPLLPNLSFKIKQGDSLVRELGGIYINLKEEIRTGSNEINEKIRELIDKKKKFFAGKRKADLSEIKEIELFEQDIFKDILQLKISNIKREIKELVYAVNILKSQGSLIKGITKYDREIKEKEEEIRKKEIQLNNIKRLLSNLFQKTQKDYFLWEIDFIEVFVEKGGFDIVIGNPPYVRQELIAPPLENEKDYSEDEWREIKKVYKEKIIQSVKNIWNNDIKIDRKSDLYVYFYYQGLSLLRNGGIFCFINSNSWLDVGYGAGLQEFLLKRMKPIYILDNLRKRSFKQADVNTIIVVIQNPYTILEDYSIKFIAFKKPFEEVNNSEVIKQIELINQPTFEHEDFRIFPKSKKELLYEGIEIPDDEQVINIKPELFPYIGNKWGGKYLRAPEIYFKILEKGKGKLIRLGEIAEVRRGFTTGANEFFYLNPIGKTVKEVVEISEKNPDTLIKVQNGTGWIGEIEARFLKPVIKSPRELKTIIVRLEDLNNLVFMCHDLDSKLKGTKALEYIRWGEKQGYHKRPTCKSRPKWWDLGEIFAPILSKRFIDVNFAFYLNINQLFIGDTFFVISNNNYKFISLFLNSTCCVFLIELIGRKNMGEGVLLIYGPEISNIEVISLNYIKKINIDAYLTLLNRRPLPIFTELGFDPKLPIREQEPNPLPDRKALDDIIFDALGLTEEEKKEVYWAVAELVKNRLEKARNV